MPDFILGPLLFALIQNTALLLAFIVLFDLVLKTPYLARIGPGRMVSGMLLMLIGVGIMSTPFHFGEGILLDTRTVLLSVSGLFFGWIPTVIAMIGTGGFRLQNGGIGAIPGVLTIITSGLVGLAWRAIWRNKLAALRPGHLYAFGLTAHLPMAFIIPVMLGHTGAQIYWIVTPSILLLFPLASMLIAHLLLQRLRDRQHVAEQKAATAALLEAKEAAETASRAKSDFLAVISHELMTPLNHIIGPSEMVAEQLQDNELKELMNIVLNGSAQLKQHFDRLLAFAEIEKRSPADCWNVADIRSFLSDETQSFKKQLLAKGFDWDLTVSDNVPTSLKTDYALLHTVLDNLLENALKFAHRGPIKLQLAQLDTDTFTLVIEDGGPGISDPEKISVFLPFQQRDMSLCRTSQGIGIGLALCHRLAAARDARLLLEDSASNGCRFTLFFPAKAETQTAAASNAA